MIYENICRGIFISRPNRFIAHVDIKGKTEIVHVKNTGRCKELLLPGIPVLLEECPSAHRKTKYDLIAVYKGERLINIDSAAPNKVFLQWVEQGLFLPNINYIKPEVTNGHSRFDFYIETDDRKKHFVEVKGVTLEKNRIAKFPDAPTLRGVKHLKELTFLKQHGYETYVVFVIQMSGVSAFQPNDQTHQQFGDVLRQAQAQGVHILAMDCAITENSLEIKNSVEVLLESCRE